MSPRPLPPDPARAHRPLADDDWPDTLPGALPTPPLVAAAARRQPPLTEVLQGLDARELEGQTVFDQLFGHPPTAPR